MPEPITPPTTIMIVVKRPREGRRPGVVERSAGALVVSAGAVMLEVPKPKSQTPKKSQMANFRFQRESH
jgi:hypothetical protein